MKLLSQVRKMPSHIFFFTERDGEYFKVMIQKNGRTLEISLGLVSDYLSYNLFVLFVSKFIPANYFLVHPVHLDSLNYETVLHTATQEGLLRRGKAKHSTTLIQ